MLKAVKCEDVSLCHFFTNGASIMFLFPQRVFLIFGRITNRIREQENRKNKLIILSLKVIDNQSSKLHFLISFRLLGMPEVYQNKWHLLVFLLLENFKIYFCRRTHIWFYRSCRTEMLYYKNNRTTPMEAIEHQFCFTKTIGKSVLILQSDNKIFFLWKP